MPGQTTNFAIPYPCPGDNVDCNDFSNWAAGIDSALSEVAELSERVLNQPRGAIRTVDAGQAFAAGAGPVTVAGSTVFYLDGLTVLSGVFTPDPGNDGIYILSAQFNPLNTGTTVTSFKATIVADNTVVASRVQASSTGTTIARPINLIGLGFLTALGGGGLIQWEWTGTGGPLNVYTQFSVAYVASNT